jgi:hypothetical protein
MLEIRPHRLFGSFVQLPIPLPSWSIILYVEEEEVLVLLMLLDSCIIEYAGAVVTLAAETPTASIADSSSAAMAECMLCCVITLDVHTENIWNVAQISMLLYVSLLLSSLRICVDRDTVRR